MGVVPPAGGVTGEIFGVGAKANVLLCVGCQRL